MNSLISPTWARCRVIGHQNKHPFSEDHAEKIKAGSEFIFFFFNKAIDSMKTTRISGLNLLLATVTQSKWLSLKQLWLKKTAVINLFRPITDFEPSLYKRTICFDIWTLWGCPNSRQFALKRKGKLSNWLVESRLESTVHRNPGSWGAETGLILLLVKQLLWVKTIKMRHWNIGQKLKVSKTGV